MTRFRIVIIKSVACLVGCLSNSILVLSVWGIGKAMHSNETISICLGSIIAYPLAKIASKYTKKGLKKFWGGV